MEISLKAFLVCRDVLYNSRNSSVISIINVFNQLQVNRYPAHIDSICIVAVYGGAPGEYHHHLEIFDRDVKVGDTPVNTFFLEDRNANFHAVSYIDGLVIEGPRHLIIKAILNDTVIGETTLGIYRPFTMLEETPEPLTVSDTTNLENTPYSSPEPPPPPDIPYGSPGTPGSPDPQDD